MRILSIVLLCCSLSGCFTLFPKSEAPSRIYTLTPEILNAKNLPHIDGLLVVERPHAGADLDTEKITVHVTPHKVDTFNQARWIERAPKMIQNIIVESIENTKKITAIGTDTTKLHFDYLLLTELKEFQAEPYHQKGKTHVHVGLNAKLIKMPERKLIASNNFDLRLDGCDNKMDTLVTQFDLATGHIMNKMISWLLLTIQEFRDR